MSKIRCGCNGRKKKRGGMVPGMTGPSRADRMPRGGFAAPGGYQAGGPAGIGSAIAVDLLDDVLIGAARHVGRKAKDAAKATGRAVRDAFTSDDDDCDNDERDENNECPEPEEQRRGGRTRYKPHF